MATPDIDVLVEENVALHRRLRVGEGLRCTKLRVGHVAAVMDCSLWQTAIPAARPHVSETAPLFDRVYGEFVVQERNYREPECLVALCAEVGLIPNFGLCGDSLGSAARAARQGTELGMRPRNVVALMAHVDGAERCGEAAHLGFVAALLARIREDGRGIERPDA